jgi:hypothetical protein
MPLQLSDGGKAITGSMGKTTSNILSDPDQ